MMLSHGALTRSVDCNVSCTMVSDAFRTRFAIKRWWPERLTTLTGCKPAQPMASSAMRDGVTLLPRPHGSHPAVILLKPPSASACLLSIIQPPAAPASSHRWAPYSSLFGAHERGTVFGFLSPSPCNGSTTVYTFSQSLLTKRINSVIVLWASVCICVCPCVHTCVYVLEGGGGHSFNKKHFSCPLQDWNKLCMGSGEVGIG